MSDHQTLAKRLRSAYQGGAVAPLRDGLATDDAAGAYQVQAINTRHWLEQGRRIVGRKVGLTSLSVQKQFGVDQPDFGVLFDDMWLPDGGMLSPSAMLQPRVEAEVALVLARDVTSLTANEDDIAAATLHAVAALEIVDSRIADWKISFADTVADNGSSAGFVLGRQSHGLAGLDLYSCGMVLEVNGAVASVGAGAACLGHPLKAAAWLARTLAAAGEPLRAGDIVLTGALGPMVSLNPGDSVMAKIGGLGTVAFSYGDAT
ncbi:2-keto-4-pentenoate hydratase [Pseudomonas silensiensis]|uniref:2-keto-4-pentenoate hydratase n=1 Tax=Pseudomonas silensiensis TaxID=2991049 RepID=UPI003D19DFC8